MPATNIDEGEGAVAELSEQGLDRREVGTCVVGHATVWVRQTRNKDELNRGVQPETARDSPESREAGD